MVPDKHFLTTLCLRLAAESVRKARSANTAAETAPRVTSRCKPRVGTCGHVVWGARGTAVTITLVIGTFLATKAESLTVHIAVTEQCLPAWDQVHPRSGVL